MVWAVFTLVVLALLAAAFWWLRRARPVEDQTRRQTLAVYRAQLSDLDRDVDQGRLSREEADAAAIEIKRRALAADRLKRGDAGRPMVSTALAAGLVTGGFALGALGYAVTGAPGLSPQPIAARSDSLPPGHPARQRSPQSAPKTASGESMADLVNQLEQVLADDPNRPDGWAMLGRSAGRIGQWEQSARAYQRATELAPDNEQYWINYGEALMQLAEGKITPAARLAFNKAGQIEPRHPAVAYYTGIALAQQGNTDQAVTIWQDALDRLPDDAQRARAPFRQAIERARPGSQALSPAPAMPQPSEEAQRAARDMSPEQRQAFINSMVNRLAARLEENPDDRDGWLRLARARGVQGKNAKAAEAYRRALALTDDPEQADQIRRQLEALESAAPTQ